MPKKTLYLTIKDLKQIKKLVGGGQYKIKKRKSKRKPKQKQSTGYNMDGVKSTSSQMHGYTNMFQNTSNINDETNRLKNKLLEYQTLDEANNRDTNGMKINRDGNSNEIVKSVDDLKNSFNVHQNNFYNLAADLYKNHNYDYPTIEELPDDEEDYGFDFNDNIDVPDTNGLLVAEGNPKGAYDENSDYGMFAKDYQALQDEIKTFQDVKPVSLDDNNNVGSNDMKIGGPVADDEDNTKRKYNIKPKTERDTEKDKLINDIQSMGGSTTGIENNLTELRKAKTKYKKNIKLLLGEYIVLGGESNKIKNSNNINKLQSAINKLKK